MENKKFAKLEFEEGDFFGEISVLLSRRKSPFEGKFLADSTFWAIRGDLTEKVKDFLT